MLRERINTGLKEAMKAKDDVGVRTLRLILAALKDRDIAARGQGNATGIDDDAILGLLQSMIKQRRESIEFYEKAGRDKMVAEEKAEIEVIEQFLPRQLGDDEMAAAVDDAIADVGAQGVKDMGKVMGKLKQDYAGQMDFGKASKLVKDRLNA